MSSILAWLWGQIVSWARRHPEQVIILAVAVARLFATTVETGWAGVLFQFGRARRVVGPGLRWLVPAIQTVRKVHVRAITMDLPRQRVTTADGMVYDVDANVVYRVADPMKAMIEIDDFKRGCRTVFALVVQSVMSARTRESLVDRKGIDDEIASCAAERLRAWGLDLDHAGLTSIAPTDKTIRFTQLGRLCAERLAAVRELAGAGLASRPALTLLGAAAIPVSHSRARYRAGRRRGLLRLAQEEQTRILAAQQLLLRGDRAYGLRRWKECAAAYRELKARHPEADAWLRNAAKIEERLLEAESEEEE